MKGLVLSPKKGKIEKRRFHLVFPPKETFLSSQGGPRANRAEGKEKDAAAPIFKVPRKKGLRKKRKFFSSFKTRSRSGKRTTFSGRRRRGSDNWRGGNKGEEISESYLTKA